MKPSEIKIAAELFHTKEMLMAHIQYIQLNNSLGKILKKTIIEEDETFLKKINTALLEFDIDWGL